jgi:hypothetical protein
VIGGAHLEFRYRAEATRCMVERKAGRSDASEVLREATDAWMKRRK